MTGLLLRGGNSYLKDTEYVWLEIEVRDELVEMRLAWTVCRCAK